MTNMRKLDVEKVEAALKRAAQEAVSGNRDAQAGRFTAISATRTLTDSEKLSVARAADSKKI